ncbi:hypothetical protein SAMN04488007_0480 [Maribacter aquivivus]|uniref:DUF4304 domain-containing protein n=1 Tax=Maribacter aquivivus TaxID=228958 RepID=A0A1M6JNX1_9FLAO|nr:hypothetical protein [Maribacter aquivivus]SHJ48338.1 hypothetical protein SAMN04488007_0480 [Maribacter aquivivus]
MEIKLTEGKKELFKVCKPWFNDEGFIFQSKRPVSFIKENEDIIVRLGFTFTLRSNTHSGTVFHIGFKKVENIILEIGLPNRDLSKIALGDDYLDTIFDNDFVNTYKQIKFNVDFSTIEGFRQWAHLIVDYAQGPGQAFIDTYSYLPNVLKEMDRLEAEGKYWKEILVGLADYDFRGLIISKLCSDPYFEEKVASRDEVFYKVPQLKDWIPYYNKLKERLKTIEPLYPYYKNV